MTMPNAHFPIQLPCVFGMHSPGATPDTNSGNYKRNRRKGGITLSSMFIRVASVFILIWLLVCVAVLKYVVDSDGEKKSANKLWSHLRSEFINRKTSDLHSSSSTASLPRVRLPDDSMLFSLDIKKPEGPTIPQYLILKILDWGGKNVRIKLRPDWSAESVDYLVRLVEQKCSRCSFYRIAEVPVDEGDGKEKSKKKKLGILLGNMANHKVPLNTIPGKCPDEKAEAHKNCKDCDCKDCECHGPILKRGLVGWSGRTAGGPDFFVNLYEDSLKSLGTSFTVFGEVESNEDDDLYDDSYKVLEEFLKEDTSVHESKIFDDRIYFDIELE